MHEQEADTTSPAATLAQPPTTPLPPWLMRLCGWMALLVYSVGAAAQVEAVYLAQGAYPSYVLAVLALLALGWIAVGVHEAGHALAARIAGMIIPTLSWGRIEIALQRRGFRMRWAPRPAGRLGHVVAVPPVAVWDSKKFLWVIAGGVLANAFTAFLALTLAWATPLEWLSWCALGFAALNISFAIANLLPFFQGNASDGLQLLVLLRARPGAWPDPASRVISLSVADREIPADLLAQTDAMGPHGQLLACYVRMKMAQVEGAWQASLQHAEQQARIEAAMPPAVLAGVARMSALLRHETAFSRAVIERDPHFCAWLPRNRDIAWLVPHMAPRCQALAAALQGDAARMESQLKAARRLADNSLERSVASGEARLAEHIRAICADAEANQPTRFANA